MKKKTIIAIWGRSNQGKSEVIRNTHNKYCQYPNSTGSTIKNTGEVAECITLIMGNGNIKIAFESQGDPNTNLETRLVDKINSGCDIIICASRTRGETSESIEHIATKYNYRIIWMANYTSNSIDTQKLNEAYSNNIVRLINDLITKDI